METKHGACRKEFNSIIATNKTPYPVGQPQWAIKAIKLQNASAINANFIHD